MLFAHTADIDISLGPRNPQLRILRNSGMPSSFIDTSGLYAHEPFLGLLRVRRDSIFEPPVNGLAPLPWI